MMTLTPTTPLLPALTPVRSVVPLRWRAAADLVVDADAVSWNGHRLPFASVRSVAYATRPRLVNLVQRRVERRVHLAGADDVIAIELATGAFGPRHETEHRSAYEGLVSMLHAVVEPRLRTEHLRQIAAGHTVPVGPLTLDRAGVAHAEGGRLSWDRLPTAALDGADVSIRAALPRPTDRPWHIPMICPNAVLLPELLDECGIAFA